jgi:Lon protease-like protein
MPMNVSYHGAGDLPGVIPVFPLAGALLLPRGQMPLNIFEPRYLAMIDDALRSGQRLIGMIQPDPGHPGGTEEKPNLYRIGCVGRITQIAESGDGRYLLQLTGVARYRIEEELTVSTPYRQCRVSFAFPGDFVGRDGQDEVDREGLLHALSDFLKANNLKADWKGIESAPNEALVNALAMMSPYGAAEKQALLEAPDLKTRAEILIAVTEIELAKKAGGGETPLQ